MRLLFRRIIPLSLLAATVLGIAYLRSEGFASSWRDYVTEQLDKRGIYLTLQGLRLDPFEGGLVARGIQVFQEADRHTLLATVDRLNIDLDLSRLMHKQVDVQGVDLRDANLSFPIDPEDPKSEQIMLQRLSAIVLVTGERIEIRRAEGDLYGLHLSIVGSLLRPPPSSEEEEEEARKRNRERLAALRARRDLIVEAAKLLKHFETARAPRLEIEVNGDLGKPEELEATMRLSADGLRHGDYVCEQLDAEATYSGRLVEIRHLHLKDHLGVLEAGASYEINGGYVDFHVRSGVNLPKLAAAVLGDSALREVVFYEPVDIISEGRVLLGEALPKDAFVPVECSGSVHAGRFASRGEVLEGLDLNFGLSPEGCYFRDVLLRHKSGTLGLQAMWKKPQDFRYRSTLRMDPHVFLPFLGLPDTEDFIKRFTFRNESNIFAELEGEGTSPDIGNKCRNQGHAELHNFKYNGTDFMRVETDMEFEGPQHVFREMRADRHEGSGSAPRIDWDDDAHTVTFHGLKSTLDPVEVVRCFAPDKAEIIAHYRFDKHPRAELNGLLALEGPGTDLSVNFSGDGVAHYMLWDEDYTISKPAGELKFKGPKLDYNVTGVLFGKEMSCKGDVDLDEGAHDYTVDFRAGLFPYQVFSKKLPFEKVRTIALCRKGLVDFEAKATTLGGGFLLRGKVDDRKTPQPMSGELRLDALDFKKFASVYSPEFDTEGDVTGHVEFTGLLGDWKSLKGKGALVILNSNLYAVPILGPLTPLLGGLLPKPIKGYNVAKEADATFTLANGFATTNDLLAKTTVFDLVAKGQVDYLEDRVQFHAQVKLFGKLLGLVLSPVSKILEYTGEGTVEDPLWRPRFFSTTMEKTPFRKSDEAPPPMASAPGAPVPAEAHDSPPARPATKPVNRSPVKERKQEKDKDDDKTGIFSTTVNPPARTGK